MRAHHVSHYNGPHHPTQNTNKRALMASRHYIKPIEHYFNSRLLRWAGHVARMETHCLPRKLLTSWVEHPRKRGGQVLNWGRSLKKALSTKNLPTDFFSWSEIAQDRVAWRKTTHN